jgi:ATPase family associated with various cellular activities (AAA)
MNPTLEALLICVQQRVPVLLWGGPGTGKTSVVTALAAAADLPIEVVIASIREPSDFAGLPVVTVDSVRFAPPSWATRLVAEGRGILFLDELSTTPPAVQAALLRVVLERTVGDLSLPDAVSVVAAANPPEQAADGWDLAAPLANRFCHLDWKLDAVAFTDGLVSGFPKPEPITLNTERMQQFSANARAAVAAFIRSRPHLAHKPPTDSTEAGRAWPSPRSWTVAAQLLAAAESASLSGGAIAQCVAGCVGAPVAAEFLAWREALDLPDPEDILLHPTSFTIPERSDKAYAVLAALTAAVAHNNTIGRWEAAWQAIAHAAQQGTPDVAVATVRRLIALRPDGAAVSPEALRAMAPVMRLAGLLDSPT